MKKVGLQCIVDLFELHPFVKEHFRSLLVHYNEVESELFLRDLMSSVGVNTRLIMVTLTMKMASTICWRSTLGL